MHVVILRPIHPEATERLSTTPGVTVEVLPEATPAELADALPRAGALIVRLTPITAAAIAAAPALRIVARHGVGYDAVDVAALTARGIPLTITPEANAGSVAEHALMLMLAVARRVTAYDANLRIPLWGARPELPTFDLAGRTVLVMGYGRIGARVARLCAAFGMRVLVHDPAIPVGTIRGAGVTVLDDLGAALAAADVVTLHLPPSAATRRMVDAAFLARMKPGAVLINTARGTLVDEPALADALRSGALAGAGLDVFHDEPVTTALPLLAAPNLIVTPHTAASTAEGMRRMALSCADSVLAHRAGTLPRDVVVNPEVLDRPVPGAPPR